VLGYKRPALRRHLARKGSFHMQAIATLKTDTDTRRPARLGLTVYFAIVLALSAAIEGFLIANPDKTGAIALLMFVPTVASVVARLVLREGFSDVSFRFGGLRGLGAIGIALVFPVAVGIVAYGAAWTTGLAGLDALPSAGVVVPFAFGMGIGLVLAAGEEIGWRGYMLTRLIDAGVPRPVLVGGLIWALWHVPLVLGGVYAAGPSPALSAVLIVVSITSFGYVIGRLRLESGSVWPAVVLHGAWNRVIQQLFDPATTGAGATLWVGESGVLTALTLILAAVGFSRGSWTILREPPRREKPPAQRQSVRAQAGIR
jgi:membrane protease YdiL (CAAX protease family)